MTKLRVGVGPVFIHEWKIASRRWQLYAVRSLFVFALLLAIVCIWMSTVPRLSVSLIHYLAELGEGFYLAVIGTQLALVMVAAPAATAGATCLDRARGTLLHMLMTDLSSAEIVLGKLAARLVPVLWMLACAFPVLVILTLLGGVDPIALVSGFAITLGVAVLGCSLAMSLSLWVGKTHEALLCTYAIWMLWLLAGPMSGMLGSTLGWSWLVVPRRSEPFFLALAPYWWPGGTNAGDYLLFLGVTLGISVALVVAMTMRLRSLCISEPLRKLRKPFSPANGGNMWRVLTAAIPALTPSLDGNPVVWREWRRTRPSRWMMLGIALYSGLSMLFSVLAILGPGGMSGAIVNGVQLSIGLLLLSVTAATSLAEERACGSLDLLLSTPLSTRQIVLGKWLGAFRVVPLLAVLPTTVILSESYVAETARWWLAPMMIAFVICVGAAITGLALLMATRFSRVGRAVGWTVAVYVLIAVGWAALFVTMYGPRSQQFILASPLFWAAMSTIEAGQNLSNVRFFGAEVFWIIFYALAAISLVLTAISSFDRRLGRIDDADTWLCLPTRILRIITALYVGWTVCFGSFLVLQTFDATLLPIGTGVIFTLGLLLIAIRAAWPLADKMSTSAGASAVQAVVQQMSVRILLAKWATSARLIPGVLLMPMFLAFCLGDGYFIEVSSLLVLLVFMLGVSLTAVSLGVAMFAWCNRGPWAVAMTVLVWAISNAGWSFLAFAGLIDSHSALVSTVNPSLVVSRLLEWIIEFGVREPNTLAWAMLAGFVYATFGGLLLLAAVLTSRLWGSAGADVDPGVFA